jgi:elongator complex protein 2
LDQTTRVHAPLLPSSVWHEIGRPQIHGYDLIDVAHVGDSCFASIAEEKVVRVFEASQPFIKVMKQLGAFEEVDEVRLSSLTFAVRRT